MLQYKNSSWPCGVLILCMISCFTACTRFKDNLSVAENGSGIIKLVKNGTVVDGAQIDEEFTVYAKIGSMVQSVEIYISDVPAGIVSRGSKWEKVSTTSMGASKNVEMDTFNIKVPAAAKLGPGSIYLKVDHLVQPIVPFLVKRPDILSPNKVTIETFITSYYDSVVNGPYTEYIIPKVLRDGKMGEAVVYMTSRLTYDEDNNTFYFVDQQPLDQKYFIRMLKDGVVTTIAGGGNDYFATTGKQLRLPEGYITENDMMSMEPGPDGKLYFTNCFGTEPDPVTWANSSYALIQRIDPHTGVVELVAGGTRAIPGYPSDGGSKSYLGFVDGKADTAMINSPRQLTFTSDGQLYFLDGWGDGVGLGSVLRRVTKEGMIETVLGKVNKDIYSFEDTDGKTYHIPYYSAIGEHTDGFGDEVRFANCSKMALAGNGRLYILGAGAGWGGNIVEVNLETKEAATIVGQPENTPPLYFTGTFKEVSLMSITTFDVDFDGNLLLGQSMIYKMDLQNETISLLTDRGVGGTLNQIVFDQFGNLYCGLFSIMAGREKVRATKLIVERN